jgi:protein-S-isoprenylcysteine O-methyltransferase Ste14
MVRFNEQLTRHRHRVCHAPQASFLVLVVFGARGRPPCSAANSSVRTWNVRLCRFLIVLGVALNLWTDRLFKQEGVDVLPTSPSDRTLITSGPFGLTRNPMYLGMVAILIGVASAPGTALPFCCAAAFFALVNATYIPFEERKLAAQFPDAFAAYAQRTRRWL